MRTITAVTEKRLKSADCKYSHELRYILNQMKSRIMCLGAPMAEIKRLGFELPNETQINVYGTNEIRGLSYQYNDYIRYIGTNDLSYVDIDDFNGLVNAVLDGSGKHNPEKG
jgi:hypothetical protein